MRLVDVYTDWRAARILWQLLEERPPEACISHRKMPLWSDHEAFLEGRPYAHWYLVDVGQYVGAVYLTHQREVGIGVLRQFAGFGYGHQAVQLLMEQHPGRFLANIAPGNDASLMLFRKMGFGGPIQVTLEKP